MVERNGFLIYVFDFWAAPLARHAEFARIISKLRRDGGIIDRVSRRSTDCEVKWEIPVDKNERPAKLAYLNR